MRRPASLVGVAATLALVGQEINSGAVVSPPVQDAPRWRRRGRASAGTREHTVGLLQIKAEPTAAAVEDPFPDDPFELPRSR